MFKRLTFLTLLVTFMLPSAAHAFDLLGENLTHVNNRRWQINFGLNTGSLISAQGVQDDSFNIGFRIGFGYSFTRRMRLEFLYQFQVTPFISPDLIAGGTSNNSMHFNSEVFRFVYRYDRYAFIPYAFLGVGLYQLDSLSSNTGLQFPGDVQLPIGAGIETYIDKDRWSVSAEYTYHLLFDEDQDLGTLALLGLNRVSFDIQTIALQFHWHFF